MRLLVGLGNPGPKYQANRHNIGFMAADEIVRRYGLSAPRSRFHGETFEGTVDGEKVLVLKPTTFMNESGRAVGEAVRFFKLPIEAVFVIHDEIDLAAGKVRVKRGGGHAGHNGLRSIVAHLGSPEFMRVRLGVGHPGDKEKVHGHVLSDFSKHDMRWVDAELDAIAKALPSLLAGRDSDFMSQVAMAVQQATGQGRGKSSNPSDAAAPDTPSGTAAGAEPSAKPSQTTLGTALDRALSKFRGS